MKLIYGGTMSECFVDGLTRMMRGKPTEVEDRLARKLLKENPKDFKKPDTGRRRALED